jgi:hypothetical protein
MDLAIAVLLPLCALLMSIVTWRVTIDPVVKRQRRTVNRLFRGIAVATFILAAVQAWRGYVSQAHNQNVLNQIAQQARPTAVMTLDRFLVNQNALTGTSTGDPVQVGLGFRNTGSDVAKDVFIQWGTAVTRIGVQPTKDVDNEVFSSINALIRRDIAKVSHGGLDLEPGKDSYDTVSLQFGPDDLRDLRTHRRFLYTAGVVQWTDARGGHERELCYIWIPQGNGQFAHKYCELHNVSRNL